MPPDIACIADAVDIKLSEVATFNIKKVLAKQKARIEIKPDLIVIPIKSKEQEGKEFHKFGKQLLKKIAKAYRIQAKDIKMRRRKDKCPKIE